ncbi:hypothetical protein QBC46DRAFT_392471 [Diplogelasinospora grovesii]|uniref:Uncharacterized protein n=1 Tax=Diplogelasinospora grovesii TaxID=303347 RepID=A0AAN6N1N7_9PEZI|nr:hypothetical protein QBC46DRAFT_392471 [Diplogelasinospora grovesii]
MIRLGSIVLLVSTVLANDGPGCPPPLPHPPSSTLTTSTISENTHCPTVTSTTAVCSTCTVIDCLYLSTISNPCDCSDPVPTVYTGYDCAKGGAGSCPTGCGTVYVSATSSSSCPGRSTPTPTSSTTSSSVGGDGGGVTSSSLPASCTYKPTQTVYSRSGCATPCATNQFCIVDAAVTVPCGCPSVSIQPSTTTICASATGCIECTTGWGFFTVSESGCTTATAKTRTGKHQW